MRIRLRHRHGVRLDRAFSSTIRGGVRGFGDAVAMETFSNDLAPTIRTLSSFVVITEVYEREKR